MAEFQLSIVAPDKSVLESPANSVIVPGLAGYFGVMAGHMPFIAALKTGVVEYEDGGPMRHYVAISGGFAEVTPSRVTLLADAAERAPEIDVSRAERALERARHALRGEESEMSTDEATHAMERAINRLHAANLASK